MVTVPANTLLRQSIHMTDPDPRMPAILKDEDWEIWLGEKEAPIEQVKAAANDGRLGWTIAPEPKKSKPTKPKAPPKQQRAPDGGLF